MRAAACEGNAFGDREGRMVAVERYERFCGPWKRQTFGWRAHRILLRRDTRMEAGNPPLQQKAPVAGLVVGADTVAKPALNAIAGPLAGKLHQ
jgi:hypothetical protein